MPRRRKRRSWRGGSITYTGGGRARIRWRDATGRRHSESVDAELAEAALAIRVGRVAAGEAGTKPDPKWTATLKHLVPPWLEVRTKTHRSHGDDASRWKLHLAPALGHMRPDEVGAAELRRLINDRLSSGLSSSTVRLLMRLLSTLYSDLIDDGHASSNPVKNLPRKIRRLFRPAHDPRTTPFLERWEDVGRLFLELPEPANIAFAIGALAGLRTGEILALRWTCVDLARRLIHVRASIGGPLKDDESRFAPVLDALLPILAAWYDRRVGPMVIPPLRTRARHFSEHALGRAFTKARDDLKLPELSFYQATRHTFASHWVMSGRTLEELREILGHSSITTTERYAHLRPDMHARSRASLPQIGSILGPEDRAPMKGLRGKVLEVPRETL